MKMYIIDEVSRFLNRIAEKIERQDMDPYVEEFANFDPEDPEKKEQEDQLECDVSRWLDEPQDVCFLLRVQYKFPSEFRIRVIGFWVLPSDTSQSCEMHPDPPRGVFAAVMNMIENFATVMGFNALKMMDVVSDRMDAVLSRLPYWKMLLESNQTFSKKKKRT